MLQAQSALGDAQEEIRKLKEQVATNDRIKEIEADLEWESDGGFRFRKSEKAKGQYPYYCPVCWGSETKLVPLIPSDHPGEFDCVTHKKKFHTKVYQEWSDKQTGEMNNSVLRGSRKTGGTWMSGG